MAAWFILFIANLRNRTGEERRRQTLCDKRDKNLFVTHKRFAVLFFLPSCCANSLIMAITRETRERLERVLKTHLARNGACK